jgi:hypothetical protein
MRRIHVTCRVRSAIVACFFALVCNTALGLTIVAEGKSDYSIVVPDDSIPAERRSVHVIRRPG